MTKIELNNEILKACKEQPTMMKASKQVGIPYSTFKCKAIKLKVWKPNQGSKGIYVKNTNELLKSKTIRTQILKNRLIEEKIKFSICEECGQTENWNNKYLVLELHHINSDNTDNRLENLKILCPNCHSQTLNFRGRNNISIKDERKITKYCGCGKLINNKSKQCKKCNELSQRKVERPPYKQLIKEIEELGYCETGRKYDVSDNAIRKWIKNYKNADVS